MGYCTPNQKLACFVLYLKMNNTSLKTDMNLNICDMIKGNESDVGNIDFEL